MNIFYLNDNPVKAAQAMTNKHVVKMIVESAQILSTAHRVLDGAAYIQLSKSGARLTRYNHPTLDDILYKSTHVNHPSCIWVRESVENYEWLYNHFIALCDEYTSRYNAKHLTEIKLRDVLKNSPVNIPIVSKTPVRMAISNEKHIVEDDAIQSYLNYYMSEKLNTDEDKKRFYSIIGN